MKLVHLTYFILEVNAAIDSGKYQDVSIREVEQHIEGGDLIPWLQKRLGDGIDLGLYRAGGGEDPGRELTAKLADILGGYKGKERRKWGVSKSGLCLLVAWANEIIQRQEFETGKTGPAGEEWLRRQLKDLDEPNEEA